MIIIQSKNWGQPFVVRATEAGTIFDVSFATTRKINYLRPDSTTTAVTATFTTDGTDGKIQFTPSTEAFFTLTGRWHVQGLFESVSQRLNTQLGVFEVRDNIGN